MPGEQSKTARMCQECVGLWLFWLVAHAPQRPRWRSAAIAAGCAPPRCLAALAKQRVVLSGLHQTVPSLLYLCWAA